MVSLCAPTALQVDPITLGEIRATVEHYRVQFIGHPFCQALDSARDPAALIERFARTLYADHLLMLPLMAMLRDRCRDFQLRQVIKHAVIDQLEANRPSRLTLCRAFLASLGVESIDSRDLESLSPSAAAFATLSSLNEAQIAGWIFATESLAPGLIAMILPSCSRLANVDVGFLNERFEAVGPLQAHEEIFRCIEDLLIAGADPLDVLEGIHLAGRAAVRIPDALVMQQGRLPRKRLRLRQSR